MPIHDKKDIHHLHIVLTPEQYRLLTDNAKRCGLTGRGLYLPDRIYELMYQAAKK